MYNMKIEIWSDVMCPFCYIGKRHFEEALNKFEHKDKLDIEWKSFQLDPTLPQESIYSYTGYLAQKRNVSEDQALEMLSQVENMAKDAGLTYHMAQSIIVNSFNAHRVIQYAKEHNKGDEMEESLFKAFFTDGQNIADPNLLSNLATQIGLSKEGVETALADDKYAYAVRSDIDEARQIGVTGVPFFVMDRKIAVSGAQPSNHILDTINKAFSQWSSNQSNPIIEISNGNSCDINGNCD